jgi:catechol-2,3-dioxygenase
MKKEKFLAVHSVDHFDLSLPDLLEAEKFYRAFGLDVQRQAHTLKVGAAETGHYVIRAHQGTRKKLLGLSFGIHLSDLERFIQHFSELGLEFQRKREEELTEILCLRDPDGTPIELRVAKKTSPSIATDPRSIPRQMSPTRSQAKKVQPRRFSHILLFTSNIDASIRFYRDALGLNLSDRAGGEIAFMHTPHGSDHHLVAFVQSTGPGLHHSSWDVATIDDIGIGRRQLELSGYGRGWGVGRHVLGSNYFFYAQEPWGGYIEYSFDMDFIPGPSTWVAKQHDAEDAFYIWGPQPPEGFGDNSEL